MKEKEEEKEEGGKRHRIERKTSMKMMNRKIRTRKRKMGGKEMVKNQ